MLFSLRSPTHLRRFHTMSRHIACLLSLCLLGLYTITAVAADSQPPEGFTALFNGKDLTGWKGLVKDPKQRAAMSPDELAAEQAKADQRMRDHWKAENNILVFDGKGDNL